MIIVRDSVSFPQELYGSVMALGNFDGMHLGHQMVIRRAVTLAKAEKCPAAAMTFEPHPRRVFHPELPTLRILPFSEKAALMRDLGVDALCVVHFTRAFSMTPAAQFVEHILHRQLRVRHVITGDDFTFGFNREGDAGFLAREAGRLGFEASACPPVLLDGIRCSSTHIRAALAEGRVGEASRFLGRPYTLSGKVREGDKRGRKLGFPTANILPRDLFTPANGIYAVRVKLRGQWQDAVASLGTRPTFGEGLKLLEVHLFDFSEDIYGEKLDVAFVKQLREERKYDTVEALTDQMALDCEAAKKALTDEKKA